MRRGAVLAATIAVGGVLAPPAGAVTGVMAGTFTMQGRITRAIGIRGEHEGQRMTRTWALINGCQGFPCQSIAVARFRGGQQEFVGLRAAGEGVWSGSGSFTFPLRCAGKRYPKGGLARFAMSVRVLEVQLVQSVPFATSISASYEGRSRINRTPCAGGFGSDAARYTGTLASPLPTPPQAAFGFQSRPFPDTTVDFSDASQGAASVRWDFGDPASGDANAATGATASHTFSAHGTYTVTMTVTDAYGLTGTSSQSVTV